MAGAIKEMKTLFLLAITLITACTTRLNTSECVWYREPTAEQCESLYSIDRELFRLCTLNKMDYVNNCKD
jgi:hypothetical protein